MTEQEHDVADLKAIDATVAAMQALRVLSRARRIQARWNWARKEQARKERT